MKEQKLIFVTSIALFILVLIGVCVMTIISQNPRFNWIESFAPLIVLTGFFIFLISVGLFFYGLVRLMKN